MANDFINGKRFTVTGKLEHFTNRKELTELIEENGGMAKMQEVNWRYKYFKDVIQRVDDDEVILVWPLNTAPSWQGRKKDLPPDYKNGYSNQRVIYIGEWDGVTKIEVVSGSSDLEEFLSEDRILLDKEALISDIKELKRLENLPRV